MTGILFILFMTLVSGSIYLFDNVMTNAEAKERNKLETCIMEQIELSEENRESYFPRMRDELLHGFIMKCIKDKHFREGNSVYLKSSSNDSSDRKPIKRKTK